ncbi:MAG: O-antigen ligase family protein, partial [Pedobacter sp.]
MYMKASNVNTKHNQDLDTGWGWQRVILLMIIFQSIGIRIIPIQSALVSVVICLILASRINIPFRQLLFFIIFGGIIVFLSARINSNFTLLFYIFQIILVAFIFNRYVNMRWPNVEYDLLVITWWLSLHGLISYLVFMLMPSIFHSVAPGGLSYKYCLFLTVISKVEGPARATGLCWEAGLLQYVANISLFLGIKHSWPRWKLAVSFLTVVATFSTAGIFVLSVNMLYLLVARRRSLSQWISIGIAIAIVFALGVTVFQTNITDKLGGKNLSGLARLRDFQIGLELIKEKSLFGHGLFDTKYLVSKSKIYELSTELFSKEQLADAGDMAAGYT